MTERIEPSYVVMNSWQIDDLTVGQRSILNESRFVITCNGFIEHWRRVGFIPTTWVTGDTRDSADCKLLKQRLTAIKNDAMLKSRLRHIFVCCESHESGQIVLQADLPITLYSRWSWSHDNQRFAKSLYEPLYHKSTGTDLVNLAMLLNPTGQIRITGCQRGMYDGYFWTDPDMASNPKINLCVPMWDAFAQAKRDGWDLMDCNFQHHPDRENEYPEIPKGVLI